MELALLLAGWGLGRRAERCGWGGVVGRVAGIAVGGGGDECNVRNVPHCSVVAVFVVTV